MLMKNDTFVFSFYWWCDSGILITNMVTCHHMSMRRTVYSHCAQPLPAWSMSWLAATRTALPLHGHAPRCVRVTANNTTIASLRHDTNMHPATPPPLCPGDICGAPGHRSPVAQLKMLKKIRNLFSALTNINVHCHKSSN